MAIDLRVAQSNLAERHMPVKLSTLETALAGINQVVIKEGVVSRFTCVKWNGSPRGNLKTEKAVRDHFGMADTDVAYILMLDGEEMYFQYQSPAGEIMTETNWEAIADKHLQRKVTQLADAEMFNHLTEKVIDLISTV